MKLVFRVFFYLLGLFSLAMGVSVSLNGGLGVSPVNSFPIAISTVSGINKGVCVAVVFGCYVVVQMILLRKQFKIRNLLQFFFATVFGYFVNFTSWIIGDFRIPTYFGQLAMLAISIVLIALGLTLYVSMDIVPMPSEGLALALTAKQTKRPFHFFKIVVDCASVTLAVVISLFGLLALNVPWTGVREGTVITALLAGRLMAVFSKFLKPRLDAICFDMPKDAALVAEAGKLEEELEKSV